MNQNVYKTNFFQEYLESGAIPEEQSHVDKMMCILDLIESGTKLQQLVEYIQIHADSIAHLAHKYDVQPVQDLLRKAFHILQLERQILNYQDQMAAILNYSDKIVIRNDPDLLKLLEDATLDNVTELEIRYVNLHALKFMFDMGQLYKLRIVGYGSISSLLCIPMSNILHLDLRACPNIDDDNLTVIVRKLPKLSSLLLGCGHETQDEKYQFKLSIMDASCTITDASLKELADYCTELKYFEIGKSNVTQLGLDNLKDALPQINIIIDRPVKSYWEQYSSQRTEIDQFEKQSDFEIKHLNVSISNASLPLLANFRNLRELCFSIQTDDRSLGFPTDHRSSNLDTNFESMRQLELLEKLTINVPFVNDDIFDAVVYQKKELNYLGIFTLTNKVSNNGFCKIDQCEKLQILDFSGIRIDDVGLEALSRCQDLIWVIKGYISNTTIKGLMAMQKCYNLQYINIRPNNDQELNALVIACPNLHELTLSDYNTVTDQGLQCIKHCQRLNHLDLGYENQITDQGLEVINHLPLIGLDFGINHNITDNGILKLEDSPDLILTNIDNRYYDERKHPVISDEAFNALQKLLKFKFPASRYDPDVYVNYRLHQGIFVMFSTNIDSKTCRKYRFGKMRCCLDSPMCECNIQACSNCSILNAKCLIDILHTMEQYLPDECTVNKCGKFSDYDRSFNMNYTNLKSSKTIQASRVQPDQNPTFKDSFEARKWYHMQAKFGDPWTIDEANAFKKACLKHDPCFKILI